MNGDVLAAAKIRRELVSPPWPQLPFDHPVHASGRVVDEQGAPVVGAAVISETSTVRHDPGRLADVVLKLIDEHVAQRSSFVRLSAPASAVSYSGTTGS